MPTPLIDPSYTSTDKNIQAQLIAMGAKGASPDSLTQTMAVSKLTPNVVVTGADVGMTPGGQGLVPVKTQIQAMTQRNGVVTPPGTPLLPTNNTTTPVGGPTSTNMGSSNPSTTPTAGDIYAGILPTGNADLDAAYAAQGDLIKATQGPIDEQAIRNDTINKFQAQIDALDRYYADVKRRRQAAETALGEGRLGTGAAIQARRGLLGSDFGQAQTDQINQNEKEIQQAIADTVDAEHNAAVQSILQQARVTADAEIANKQAAKTKGAQEYIDFLKGAAQRKDENVNTAIANLLNAQANPDDATLKSLAGTLGIDLGTLKSKIKTAQDTAAKTAAENQPKPIIVNDVAYQLQADGTYKAVTPEPKAPEEKPIVVGGVAYEKQADGTYKAMTPAAAIKPINRTVGKVMYTSLDGGATWAPASRAVSTPTTVVPPSTTTPTTPPSPTVKKTPMPNAPVVTQPKKTVPLQVSPKTSSTNTKVTVASAKQSMTKELSQLTGDDGFISPDTYLAAKKEWVGQGLSPTEFDSAYKGYRNPDNPYYTVGK